VEYEVNYVEEILFWSKDPMALIKSLQKISIEEYRCPRELFKETWNFLQNHGRIMV
jgi:superfamily I DNA and/or RNA helicase